jgi:hypothetical protein
MTVDCEFFKDAEKISDNSSLRTHFSGICVKRGHAVMAVVCENCRWYTSTQSEDIILDHMLSSMLKVKEDAA